MLRELAGLSVMRFERQWAVSSQRHMQPWPKTHKQDSPTRTNQSSFTQNDSLSHNIRSLFSTECLAIFSSETLPVEKDLTSHVVRFGSRRRAVLVVHVGRMVIPTGHFVVLKSVWAGQRANTGCRRSFCSVLYVPSACVWDSALC